MISNYFTLYHIAKLLDHRYVQTVIAEIYSQEKNTLSILLYTPEPHTIIISCTPRDNYITVRNSDIRSKKNSVDLFPAIINTKITSISMSTTDRTIFLKADNNLNLCIDIFASKANVVLCDNNGAIIDAFLHKKELTASTRETQNIVREITVDDIVPNEDIFRSEFSKNETTLKGLKKAVPKLGTTLANEILYRSSSNSDEIYRTAKDLVAQILSLPDVSPFIYSEDRIPVCFSLIPLQHFPSIDHQVFPDLFDGIQVYISRTRSVQSFTEKKKVISVWLEKEEAKAEQTLAKVQKEFSESSRAEQYELFGTLIKNNLHLIKKGMKNIQLESSFSSEETVLIPLDGSLSPVQNAERYFDKSKKAKLAKEESHQRVSYLEQRIRRLKKLLEEFNEIETGISLKNFLHLQHDQLHSLGYMTAKEHEELPPFKIFTVDGGFTVYAGKSSENNDTLTVKFAKPNDLWFHARGSSGSHVILRMGSGNGEPSKKAIEQAASIAAYYSKMKNARNVPVAMTEKKYVRKPKGVPAGTVVIEREKVIFVEPKLPDSGKNS